MQTRENRRRKSKIRKKSLGYASAPTHPIYGREGALLQVYQSSGPRTITGLASVGTAQPKHKQKEPNKETSHARSETHQKQRQQRGGAPRKGRGEQTGNLAECAKEGGHTLRYGTGSGDVGPRVVQRPTQKGKAKKRNRQAQHGVEGSAPHRYSTITKGNRAYSISRPAGNSTRKQEAVPTGETLGPLR
jgi:hypothetical protein